MDTITTPTLRILAVFTAIYDVLKERKHIASGELYALMMGSMDLDTYQLVIKKLTQVGSVTIDGNHLLEWASRGKPYNVTRTAEESWIIDGLPTSSLDEACRACEACDQIRGSTWDMFTHGLAQDGLTALKIGESLEVNPMYDDEDE